MLVFSGGVLEDDITFGLDRLLFLMVENAFRAQREKVIFQQNQTSHWSSRNESVKRLGQSVVPAVVVGSAKPVIVAVIIGWFEWSSVVCRYREIPKNV